MRDNCTAAALQRVFGGNYSQRYQYATGGAGGVAFWEFPFVYGVGTAPLGDNLALGLKACERLGYRDENRAILIGANVGAHFVIYAAIGKDKGWQICKVENDKPAQYYAKIPNPKAAFFLLMSPTDRAPMRIDKTKYENL